MCISETTASCRLPSPRPGTPRSSARLDRLLILVRNCNCLLLLNSSHLQALGAPSTTARLRTARRSATGRSWVPALRSSDRPCWLAAPCSNRDKSCLRARYAGCLGSFICSSLVLVGQSCPVCAQSYRRGTRGTQRRTGARAGRVRSPQLLARLVAAGARIAQDVDFEGSFGRRDEQKRGLQILEDDEDHV